MLVIDVPGLPVPHNKRVSNEALLESYGRTQSVWKTAEEVGLCGQSVHGRLQKLGVVNPINCITDSDREVIRARYGAYASIGKLAVLAKEMGRTRHLICRVAGEMGLTDQKRPKRWLSVWKYIDQLAATAIWEDFKSQSLGPGNYCRKRGFDDLGFSQCMKRFFADEWEHALELKVPKQSLYRYGRQFEYRVRDHLKGLGYLVTRSPASRSPVDLIAIGKSGVLLVQCKRGGLLGVKEWNEIFVLADGIAASPIMAMVRVGGRGIDYFELTDLKDGSKRRQPMRPVNIEKADAAHTRVVVRRI